MTTLNANEIKILKAVTDNALDAAGGDFAFSDEIHAYVKEDFSAHQVAGYLSALSTKGLICIDDTYNQIELWGKEPLELLIAAGTCDTAYAETFDIWHR